MSLCYRLSRQVYYPSWMSFEDVSVEVDVLRGMDWVFAFGLVKLETRSCMQGGVKAIKATVTAAAATQGSKEVALEEPVLCA